MPVALAALTMMSPAFRPKLAGWLSPQVQAGGLISYAASFPGGAPFDRHVSGFEHRLPSLLFKGARVRYAAGQWSRRPDHDQPARPRDRRHTVGARVADEGQFECRDQIARDRVCEARHPRPHLALLRLVSGSASLPGAGLSLSKALRTSSALPRSQGHRTESSRMWVRSAPPTPTDSRAVSCR